jgi:nitroreductase
MKKQFPFYKYFKIMIKDLVKFNRSYRRFHEAEIIERQTLVELLELARLSPSPRNLQPYKFLIAANTELNRRIYETLAWAGYLPDWSGPEAGERPSAYIVIINDKNITKNLDRDNLCYGCGIVAQSILLGASERGIGGCLIGSVQRSKLAEELQLSEDYEILLVLALGHPKEKIVLEELGETGDVRYWRDDTKVHHVPKRKLEDLILEPQPNKIEDSD